MRASQIERRCVPTSARFVEVPFASETLAGTWQTAPRGAPPQARETVPLKPELGVS